MFFSRGKGLGKLLMLKTEEYCQGQGFRTAYLTTHDQQIFYSRCGYKFSESVCAFGGSSSLNLGNFSSSIDENLVFSRLNNVKVVITKYALKYPPF